MLNYIHLENFRAFGQPTTIPLAPITLLFGENSSGKTSILHALSLLKQTAEGGDPDAALVARSQGGSVDLGSFSEFLHDHDHSRTMRLGLGVRPAPARHPSRATRAMPESADCVGVHWAFRQAKKNEDVSRFEIDITDGERAKAIATFRRASDSLGTDELSPQLSAMSRGVGRYQLMADSLDPHLLQELRELFADNGDSIRELLAVLQADLDRFEKSVGGGGEEVVKHRRQLYRAMDDLTQSGATDAAFRECVVGLSGEVQDYGLLGSRFVFRQEGLVGLRNTFLGWHIGRMKLSPNLSELVSMLRMNSMLSLQERFGIAQTRIAQVLESMASIGPFRTPAARLYTYSGTRPRQVGRSGELVADLLHRDPEALKRTNEWMKRFEIGYQLRLEAIGARRSDVFEVRLVDQRRKPTVDVAFSDVGFGISQMLPIIVQSVAAQNRVITIEQPEVHIHPRLQAEVGELLVDCTKNNGHQFIIETHSEHLILRLRRLVREGKMKAEDVSVIFVGRGRDGSTVQRIGIRPDGTFDREWPGGFFPERMRELL